MQCLNMGIDSILNQKGRPIGFFGEKLNEAKRKYSNYDNEFYVIIYALNHWSNYLLLKEFILYYNHKALKYLNT